MFVVWFATEHHSVAVDLGKSRIMASLAALGHGDVPDIKVPECFQKCKEVFFQRLDACLFDESVQNGCVDSAFVLKVKLIFEESLSFVLSQSGVIGEVDISCRLPKDENVHEEGFGVDELEPGESWQFRGPTEDTPENISSEGVTSSAEDVDGDASVGSGDVDAFVNDTEKDTPEASVASIAMLRCEVCGRRFCGKTSLRKHAAVMHGTERRTYTALKKPTPCDICGKTYTGLAGLKQHQKQVHEAKRACEKCGVLVSSGYGYTHHLNLHERFPDSRCPQCHYHDPNPLNIVNHVRYVHVREKSVCDICGKETGNIRRHKISHKSDRPHKCGECGKAYRLKFELDTHLRRHVGDRRYKCERCPKAFFNTGQLKQHMNSHLGLRPYQCEYCGDTFSHSGARYTHIRLKHKKASMFVTS
ncbi:unnamed protein product [Cyprideis torosa]|uniref:Uncharacterized protein n=1 Tax=Cyprideis torosa TaxID=163714 RepID=A0A7R8WDX8_9CRUS|nr:unnamed protein product [Cyprideis torosa]CAG0895176.1 unnamed protein product [Cyprideis torosa]